MLTDREFQIELARITVRANERNAAAFALLTVGVAVAIAALAIDIATGFFQYSAFLLLTGLCVWAGKYALSFGRKGFNDDLAELNPKSGSEPIQSPAAVET